MRPSVNQDFARKAGRALAVVRCLIGIGAIIAPGLVASTWVGRRDSARTSSLLFARALGGRDLALGGAALVSTGDADLTRAVVLGALADSVDLGATLIAYSQLPRGRRFGVLISTLGAALTGALVAASLSDQSS